MRWLLKLEHACKCEYYTNVLVNNIGYWFFYYYFFKNNKEVPSQDPVFNFSNSLPLILSQGTVEQRGFFAKILYVNLLHPL